MNLLEPSGNHTDVDVNTEASRGLQSADRVDELYHAHQQLIFTRTDRVFAQLMVAQWIACIIFSVVVSPRAWSGTTSQVHIHVWAAVLLGGAIAALPIALVLLRPGHAMTRYTIAAAQMLMGALLIHLTGGRLETHFHVFGSLAFLALYRDWRVLVPATIVVATDHFLRGLFWPQSVYGVSIPSEWRWIEHAAWVAFEDVILIMACLRGTSEMRDIAVRTAGLEQAHREQTRLTMEQSELIARLRLTQQEAEAATKAKSEFVATMSHELRTPLNAITLYTEMLQEGAVADGRTEDAADLTKVQVASRHLLGLINGILDLSKIEAGKMDVEVRTFEVRQIVSEMTSTMGAVVRKNGNTLRVASDESLGSMRSDVTKIRQVLFNLLSNAGKFTSNGQILLSVHRFHDAGADWLEFAVQDTGIGLSAEQKPKLFQPFAQADTSIARRYGGTGLGLALVARFCHLMGGTVEAESPAEGGTRFVVRLPASLPDPAEEQEASLLAEPNAA